MDSFGTIPGVAFGARAIGTMRMVAMGLVLGFSLFAIIASALLRFVPVVAVLRIFISVLAVAARIFIGIAVLIPAIILALSDLAVLPFRLDGLEPGDIEIGKSVFLWFLDRLFVGSCHHRLNIFQGIGFEIVAGGIGETHIAGDDIEGLYVVIALF